MDMPIGSLHQSSHRRNLWRDRERPPEVPTNQLSVKSVSKVRGTGANTNMITTARFEVDRFTELVADYVELADRRVANMQEPAVCAFPGGTLEDKIRYYEHRSLRCTRAYEMFLKSRQNEISNNRLIFPDDDFAGKYFRRKEERQKMKSEAEAESRRLCEYITNIKKRKFIHNINDPIQCEYQRRNDENNNEGAGSRIPNHSAGDGLPNQRSTVASRELRETTPAIDGDNNTVGQTDNGQEADRPRRRWWQLRYRWLRRIWRWARKHRWRRNRSIPSDNH